MAVGSISEIEYESDTSCSTAATAPGMNRHCMLNRFCGTWILQDLKEELKGHLLLNQPSVFERLGVEKVDDDLVKNSVNRLKIDPAFTGNRDKFQQLENFAAKRLAKLQENGDKFNEELQTKRREKPMIKPLCAILESIRKIESTAVDRKWLSIDDTKLSGEGDSISQPQINVDLTLCDVDNNRNKFFVVRDGVRTWSNRVAFVEVKATSLEGPGDNNNIVTDIVARAANYARLHVSSRPFQIFTIGLLIFGSSFCVAIFEKDQISFSSVENIWENLSLFFRVIRRLSCEMSSYELGMDPNIKRLNLTDPITSQLRQFSQQMSLTHPTYPNYVIDIGGVTYFTIGQSMWTSLSMFGPGTNIWLVTSATQLDESSDSVFILKSFWKRSDQARDLAFYEQLERRYTLADQSLTELKQYSRDINTILPAGRLRTSTNLRNASGTYEANTPILHRILIKKTGRPVWEFNTFAELFLGIKAALLEHQFLNSIGIVHGDINPGSLMLSMDPNFSGFLTDLEFARFEEVTGVTVAEQRSALITGNIQFMAYELVMAIAHNKNVTHKIHHDIESFIWVIYYATLRRLAYVHRPLQDVDTFDGKLAKDGFKHLFGHVDFKSIYASRAAIASMNMLFGRLVEQLNAPLIQFFYNLERYLNVDVRYPRAPVDSPWGLGRATYEDLFKLLDKVIDDLRTLPPYKEVL